MTAPAHTRFVGYRQQKSNSAMRQDLVKHERRQSCDVLPFSPRPPVRGHYTPKAVSREKVKKLGGVAHSFPVDTAVGWDALETNPCREARLPGPHSAMVGQRCSRARASCARKARGPSIHLESSTRNRSRPSTAASRAVGSEFKV